MRLSALMHLPVIYVMTHDSIGVGEDGPTHQPVEHLAALRSIPNLTIIRPADANETAYAWQAALQRLTGRPFWCDTARSSDIDRTQCAPAKETLKGAYILAKENGDFPQIVLIGSGSEVALLLEAKKMLQNENIAVRVVSMPSWEIFRRQDAKYREAVLPAKAQKRLAVEAAVSQGWHEWIGDHGVFLGVDFFGVSAPYQKIYQEFGLTAENVAQKARELL